jgi:G3E family GTPase
MTMVPAVVVGGYLGAGKTTLVNHLLRHAGGRRIAVLVNDFGDIAIDADLIEGASGDVVALAGGCVCCSFGADLVGTLTQVLRREPRPEQVLIECSGVGLPAAVARSARLAPDADVEGVVVVVDSETVAARAADPYVGDTVRQQLRDADLLVLNKADLCTPAALVALRAWLAAAAPGAPQVEAQGAAVPPELVLGLRPIAQRTGRPWPGGPIAPPRDAAQRFTSERRVFERPVDVPALAAALAAPGSGVLRAKGWLTGLDGRRCLLQVVGRRVAVEPLPPGAAPHGPDQLLIIGLARAG